MTHFTAFPVSSPCRWAGLVVGCAALLSGCATSTTDDRMAGASANGSPPQTTNATSPGGTDETSAAFDAQFGISPMTAYELGYRVDWRSSTGADTVTNVVVQDDAALVLDDRNFLSRLRVDDGSRIWRSPVADPIDRILGINDVPDYDRVYLTAGGSLLELERSTGGVVGRQKLEKIANTQPVRLGQYLVYGSRNGQVVWHAFAVASQWRANQVAHSIKVPPVVHGDFVAVVGNDGELMVLSRDARRQWSTRLLDEVVCTPTLSRNALFVAGLDQHLRAFDIRSGRTLWKTLTRSPLSESPVLIGDYLYQQIPSEGLVRFEALPLDAPGGKKTWTAEDVSGSVITSKGRDLVTWDADRRVLQLVDETYGTVRKTVELPNAEHLFCTTLDNGDLYIIDGEGIMTRAVPQN